MSSASLELDSAPEQPATHAILLRVAYDGAAFSGLAVQHHVRTAAGVLREAILQMDKGVGKLRLASRTDAGVHAREQYVAFDTKARISSRGWLLGLNGFLPGDVAVTQVSRVDVGFHPSREARVKTYRYLILRSPVRDPFLEGRAWHVRYHLDGERMRRELESLLGRHDFRAFRSSRDERRETVREMHRVELRESDEPRRMTVEVEGNRFLHHMMRIIVGTLVDVGRGKLEPGAFERAFVSGQRAALGITAPADGLYLAALELSTCGVEKWPYQ